jgi:4-amino-4-deoxy-L-arabinose transferase-like glycosyltransferase
MRVPEGHGGQLAESRRAARALRAPPALALLVVGAATVLGVALRLVVASQSLFADELSTYWIVSTNGLGGVVSAVRTDVEITPPLYFVTAWLTTRTDLTPELLRAPSLVAGVAAIPLTYLLGVRTVGRGVGLVGAVLTALSPFMIFYSAEARGYGLMVALVLLSTLGLLAAVDDRRARWWVAYGAFSCAAVYSHYTAVFVLGAQLLWLLWAHPEARRAAVLANAAAVVAFLPWLSGLLADFDSPTTDIVDSFNTVDLTSVRIDLGHWAIGHPLVLPNTSLDVLPGSAALALLTLGVVLALVSLAARHFLEQPRSSLARLDSRLVLVVLMALSVPVGTALLSTVGPNLFGARYLAASWPAFALTLAALLVAAGARLRFATVALAIASFGIGALKLLDADVSRPEYDAAANFVASEASRGDVVIDETDYSPAPPTGIDAAFQGSRPLFHVGLPRVQYDPFEVVAEPPPAADVTRQAVAAAGRGRVFLVSSESVFARGAPLQVGLTQEVIRALRPSHRLVEIRTYPGILRLAVLVYVDRASQQG